MSWPNNYMGSGDVLSISGSSGAMDIPGIASAAPVVGVYFPVCAHLNSVQVSIKDPISPNSGTDTLSVILKVTDSSGVAPTCSGSDFSFYPTGSGTWQHITDFPSQLPSDSVVTGQMLVAYMYASNPVSGAVKSTIGSASMWCAVQPMTT